MTRGFDHTAQLGFSHNAAAGRLLGMTEPQIANAIAMAASSGPSITHRKARSPSRTWTLLATNPRSPERERETDVRQIADL